MEIIQTLRKALSEASDPKTRESSQRFFKERVKAHGVKAKTVQKLASMHFKSLNDKSKETVFAYCEELWKSGILEETFIACEWSHKLRKEFSPCDFQIFQRWINCYISNWASCDTFCNHTVGSFIMRYPDYVSSLKLWADMENLWMRRAAAVSLIVPARKGMFLKEVFEIADTLLTDKEDMVQKGYGWMLKVASQKHQQQVFTYVMKHKPIMPRTSLRYAIEKMPTELKRQAMENHKA